MPYLSTTPDAITLVKKHKIIELWVNLIQAKLDQFRTELDFEKRNEIEEAILTYIEKLEEM